MNRARQEVGPKSGKVVASAVEAETPEQRSPRRSFVYHRESGLQVVPQTEGRKQRPLNDTVTGTAKGNMANVTKEEPKQQTYLITTASERQEPIVTY